MKRLKLIIWIVLALVVASFFGSIAFYLPSTVKVHVSGTEVKRREAKAEAGTGPARDVRYVMAKNVETGEVLVFRNEDTRWGFPPYFKFKSADLAGWAADIAQKQPEAVVLLTYYGTRNSALDMFPNVISMEIVHPNYSHVPLFNIIFWMLFAVAALFLFLRIRRLKKRFRAWREKRNAPPAEPATQE